MRSNSTRNRSEPCTSTLQPEIGGGEYHRRLVAASSCATGLFHGHGLGEIARLVDVSALEHGYVISEQLQRNGVDDWCDQPVGVWHLNHSRSRLGFQAGFAIGEHIELPTARAHDLHVGFQLVEQVVVRRDDDNRHFLIDERQRSVLELTSRIGLSVDIGNLLELERAFHSNRPHRAAAQEQSVILFGELLRQETQLAIHLEHLLHSDRRVNQVTDKLRLALWRQASLSPKHQRDQQQRQ